MLPDLDGFPLLQRIRDRGSAAGHLPHRARRHRRPRPRPDQRRRRLPGQAVRSRRAGRPRAPPARRRELGRHDRLLRCADLDLDPDGHRVTRAGDVVHLSPTEYKLLHYLLLNRGRVLSRAQILDHVWAYDFDGESSVVDTYISYLRRKVDTSSRASSTPFAASGSRCGSSRDASTPTAARHDGIGRPDHGRRCDGHPESAVVPRRSGRRSAGGGDADREPPSCRAARWSTPRTTRISGHVR